MIAIVETNHIRRGAQKHMSAIIRIAVVAIVFAAVGLVIYAIRSGDEEAV